MAVSAAAARHVYGQKAYAAAAAGAATPAVAVAVTATPAAREAGRQAQPATMPPCQTQTSIRRTVAHAAAKFCSISLQKYVKC